MKCVICENNPKPIKVDEGHRLRFECCGYVFFDNDIYFKGKFLNSEANFTTNLNNTMIMYNITTIDDSILGRINDTYDLFIWKYPFNFKDKERQIKQIEKMLVFI